MPLITKGVTTNFNLRGTYDIDTTIKRNFFIFLVYCLLIFLTNTYLTKVKKKNYIPIILSLSGEYFFKNGGKGV